MELHPGDHAERCRSFYPLPSDVYEHVEVMCLNAHSATVQYSNGTQEQVDLAYLRPIPPAAALPQILPKCLTIDAQLEHSSRFWGCSVVQAHEDGMVVVLEYGGLNFFTVPRTSLRVAQEYNAADSSWTLRRVLPICRCIIDQSCKHQHVPPARQTHYFPYISKTNGAYLRSTAYQNKLHVPRTPGGWPFDVYRVKRRHNLRVVSCSQAVTSRLGDLVFGGRCFGDEKTWEMVAQHMNITAREQQDMQDAAAEGRGHAGSPPASADQAPTAELVGKIAAAHSMQAVQQTDQQPGQLQPCAYQLADAAAAGAAASPMAMQPHAGDGALHISDSPGSQQQQQQQQQHHHHHHQPHHNACQHQHIDSHHNHQQRQLQLQQGYMSAAAPSVSAAANSSSAVRQQQQQQQLQRSPAPASTQAVFAVGAPMPVVQQQQQSATSASDAPRAATLPAAPEQAVQHQQQQRHAVAGGAAAAALTGVAGLSGAASEQHTARQQQQQQASGTSAAAAEFGAGMPLRMLEQISGGMVRKSTGTVHEFLCIGCLGRGGDADAYLVRLTNITLSTDPQKAQAAAAARTRTPAAARAYTLVPVPTLQLDNLYVLKVCRPQQSLTGEQPSRAAARAFLQESASHLHNEHMCYVCLQGSAHVVHCFAYGSVAAVPSASAPSAAAPTALSSSSTAVAARMGAVERPCLLLEYAASGSVSALLQNAAGQRVGMTAEQAKCVIMHVGLALQDCHNERIIFRDLHPGNIVVSVTAAGEHCYKLTDFGSAHMMVNGLGRGALFGVPYYRLPEQLEGAYHHDTLDTGKLGLLLLELRTGEPPLPDLLGKEEDVWMAQISSVHQDILNCEQYQHLQRYACLSRLEREFVSACLAPEPHKRLTVSDLWETHEFFREASVEDDLADLGAMMSYMADTGALTCALP